MLRNFEAADADRDGVVTFSGTLMTKAGNSVLRLRMNRACMHKKFDHLENNFCQLIYHIN